jgi:hypothetical protein
MGYRDFHLRHCFEEGALFGLYCTVSDSRLRVRLKRQNFGSFIHTPLPTTGVLWVIELLPG